MSELVTILLPAVIGIIIGFFFGNRFSRLKLQTQTGKLEERIEMFNRQLEEQKRELKNIEREREDIRLEKESLNNQLATRNADFRNLEEKLQSHKKELVELREQFAKEFENLANKILDEKSSKFTKQNKENIQNLLDPLAKNIDSFKKKVEDTNKESIDRHASLRQQIEDLQKANKKMSEEAINLTKALKGDSKTQGDWGETQLEVLLEKAGLKKEVHYSTQGGFRDEQGRLKKPDFIVNLPEARHLIIDAKVSLTAYEGYYNAETDDDRNQHLKRHVDSIRKHIRDLGEKRYADLYGINTPDYVLMFIPIEPALLIALNQNNKLYLDALERNVVLVSTSTLLATLSTVSSIWKQEDQKRNVQEIVRQAAALYDKFEGFVQDLLKVGKSINASKDGYDAAMNKLSEGRGNLVRRVEMLRDLGVAPSKQLPNKLVERAREKDTSFDDQIE